MADNRRTTRLFIQGGVIVAAAAGVLALGFANGREARGRDTADRTGALSGYPVATPVAKPDRVLLTTAGEPFDIRRDTRGYLTLLFFGYTHCPDVCPVQVGAIASVLKELTTEQRERVRFVFVTTDPERDTPARLRQWLDGFDESFIGLRGDTAAVNAMQRDLQQPGAVRQRGTGVDGGYLVGHSSRVLVFGRDGLAHLSYPFGTRRADWARDLPRLIAEMDAGAQAEPGR